MLGMAAKGNYAATGAAALTSGQRSNACFLLRLRRRRPLSLLLLRLFPLLLLLLLERKGCWKNWWRRIKALFAGTVLAGVLPRFQRLL